MGKLSKDNKILLFAFLILAVSMFYSNFLGFDNITGRQVGDTTNSLTPLQQAEQDLFAQGWKYKREVKITGVPCNDDPATSSVDCRGIKDYQIKIGPIVNDATNKDDFGDLRVYDENGNKLPYWVDARDVTISGTRYNDFTAWIKGDFKKTGGLDPKIYLYYGKLDAVSESNGDNVFIFFDDFSNEAAGTNVNFQDSKWTKKYQSGYNNQCYPLSSSSLEYGNVVFDNACSFGETRFVVPGSLLSSGGEIISSSGDEYYSNSLRVKSSVILDSLEIRSKDIILPTLNDIKTKTGSSLGSGSSLILEFGTLKLFVLTEKFSSSSSWASGAYFDRTTNNWVNPVVNGFETGYIISEAGAEIRDKETNNIVRNTQKLKIHSNIESNKDSNNLNKYSKTEYPGREYKYPLTSGIPKRFVLDNYAGDTANIILNTITGGYLVSYGNECRQKSTLGCSYIFHHGESNPFCGLDVYNQFSCTSLGIQEAEIIADNIRIRQIIEPSTPGVILGNAVNLEGAQAATEEPAVVEFTITEVPNAPVCDAANPCATGEYCSSGACLIQKNNNEICGSDSQCLSGSCIFISSTGNNLCKPDNYCDSNILCGASEICSNNLCSPAPVCNPNWQCTEWTPAECPSTGTQARTCADANNCGTNSGKPEESQLCTYVKPLPVLKYVGEQCTENTQCLSGACREIDIGLSRCVANLPDLIIERIYFVDPVTKNIIENPQAWTTVQVKAKVKNIGVTSTSQNGYTLIIWFFKEGTSGERIIHDRDTNPLTPGEIREFPINPSSNWDYPFKNAGRYNVQAYVDNAGQEIIYPGDLGDQLELDEGNNELVSFNIYVAEPVLIATWVSGCTSNEQCASGNCANSICVECASDSQCGATQLCSDGNICKEKKGAGNICEIYGNRECLSGNCVGGICEAEGAQCNANKPCSDSQYCSSERICKPQTGIDSLCPGSSACQTGLFCFRDGTCQVNRHCTDAGTDCDAANQYCSDANLCESKKTKGNECSLNNECSSGNCRENKCHDAGFECSLDSTCANPNKYCDISTNKCEEKKGASGLCQEDKNCLNGLLCFRGGTCRNPGYCTESGDCAGSQYCDNIANECKIKIANNDESIQCREDDNCASNNCFNNVCREAGFGGLGLECSVNNGCQSGNCLLGQCASAGENCREDSQCNDLNNNGLNEFCSINKACTDKKTEFNTCLGNNQCLSNNCLKSVCRAEGVVCDEDSECFGENTYCSADNRCLLKLEKGQTCSINNECKTNTCFSNENGNRCEESGFCEFDADCSSGEFCSEKNKCEDEIIRINVQQQAAISGLHVRLSSAIEGIGPIADGISGAVNLIEEKITERPSLDENGNVISSLNEVKQTLNNIAPAVENARTELLELSLVQPGTDIEDTLTQAENSFDRVTDVADLLDELNIRVDNLARAVEDREQLLSSLFEEAQDGLEELRNELEDLTKDLDDIHEDIVEREGELNEVTGAFIEITGRQAQNADNNANQNAQGLDKKPSDAKKDEAMENVEKARAKESKLRTKLARIGEIIKEAEALMEGDDIVNAIAKISEGKAIIIEVKNGLEEIKGLISQSKSDTAESKVLDVEEKKTEEKVEEKKNEVEAIVTTLNNEVKRVLKEINKLMEEVNKAKEELEEEIAELERTRGEAITGSAVQDARNSVQDANSRLESINNRVREADGLVTEAKKDIDDAKKLIEEFKYEKAEEKIENAQAKIDNIRGLTKNIIPEIKTFKESIRETKKAVKDEQFTKKVEKLEEKTVELEKGVEKLEEQASTFQVIINRVIEVLNRILELLIGGPNSPNRQ